MQRVKLSITIILFLCVLFACRAEQTALLTKEECIEIARKYMVANTWVSEEEAASMRCNAQAFDDYPNRPALIWFNYYKDNDEVDFHYDVDRHTGQITEGTQTSHEKFVAFDAYYQDMRELRIKLYTWERTHGPRLLWDYKTNYEFYRECGCWMFAGYLGYKSYEVFMPDDEVAVPYDEALERAYAALTEHLHVSDENIQKLLVGSIYKDGKTDPPFWRSPLWQFNFYFLESGGGKNIGTDTYKLEEYFDVAIDAVDGRCIYAQRCDYFPNEDVDSIVPLYNDPSMHEQE